MLSISHHQRIFLARAITDMRKGADGLAALVVDLLHRDPLSGDAFIFVNRRRSMVKVLMWDLTGYWVASKRLERGTFAVRGHVSHLVTAQGSVPLSHAELLNVLEGIDVRQAAYHQHYDVKISNNSRALP